jgi:hypothetical protein
VSIRRRFQGNKFVSTLYQYLSTITIRLRALNQPLPSQQNILSTDISARVISHLRKYYSSPEGLNAYGMERYGMKFEVMDACSLPLETGSVSMLIDKGTVDSVFCEKDGNILVKDVLAEASRVLRPSTGTFILISHGQPEDRLHLLSQSKLKWNVSHYVAEMSPQVLLTKCIKMKAPSIPLEEAVLNEKIVADSMLAMANILTLSKDHPERQTSLVNVYVCVRKDEAVKA